MTHLRIAFLFLALAAAPAAHADKLIALTFDDAPRQATGYYTGPERARHLNAALRTARVPNVTFFCTTSRFDEEGSARIQSYRDAGHSIANHSYLHPDLHEVGAAPFLADFNRASRVLATYPDARKWFRFPYLHEGRTVAERDAVRTGLREAGYRPGYVTIDNSDWYFEVLFQEAVRAGRTVDFDRLRDAYVELLVESIEFYDTIAVKSLGRSPAHVLLLHETDLSALYIADLVAALRTKGWRIITAAEAYADPIADQEPETLQLGQGRVVALAIDQGYAGPKLVWEEEGAIRAEFERRGVWK